MGSQPSAMASSSLALLLTFILWVSVEATPAETLKELEMRLKSEGHQEVYLATDRDMHNWWNEYDILMANYRSMFADNVCTDPDMLNSSLAVIEAKLEKVRWGWTQKGEQLEAIREILHHEDYRNVTGLAKVLGQFLEDQFDQMDREGEQLDQEESEVAAAQAPSTPTPAPVSGTSGATGEFAAPPAEGVCPTGPGLSRRKLSMAVISAMEMRMKRKPATKSPVPSTANGATGLSGPSVTWSVEMETSTAKGPTRSQPCSAGKNAQALVPRPCPATTCWS